MSIYYHRNQTDANNVRVEPYSQAVLCSNHRFGHRVPAAEIVVNGRYGTLTVLAPCANCRRIFRQQQGRGSYAYTNLTFTGITPVAGMDFSSAAEAVRQQRAEAEARSLRERQAQIESNRIEYLTRFLGVSNSTIPVSMDEPDEYGRRHIIIRHAATLTPNMAEDMADMLRAYATRAREHARTALEIARATSVT